MLHAEQVGHAMKKRMAQKAAASGGRSPEFHESHEILVRLQAGMEKAISALRELKKFELVTLDVVDRPADELAREFIQTYAE